MEESRNGDMTAQHVYCRRFRAADTLNRFHKGKRQIRRRRLAILKRAESLNQRALGLLDFRRKMSQSSIRHRMNRDARQCQHDHFIDAFPTGIQRTADRFPNG